MSLSIKSAVTLETQFKNLIQLVKYFKDEETCKSYLAEKRWGKTPSCPHFGNTKVYITNRGYKSAAKECHKKFTITTGTIFENTKISLQTWFAAMYLCTAHKKGTSSLQLSRDLNITQKPLGLYYTESVKCQHKILMNS